MNFESNQEKSDFDFTEVDKELAEFKVFLDQLFGNYRQFLKALVSDVRIAAEQVKQADEPFKRRVYLRNFFSFVEGALYARRRILSTLIRKNPEGIQAKRLTPGEIALLDEIEYQLEDNGTVEVRSRNFQPFLKFLRFTFSVDFKYHDKPNPIDYGEAGWFSFRNVHQARNRISHPKAIEDLEVSDGEIADLKIAFQWFLDQFNKH